MNSSFQKKYDYFGEYFYINYSITSPLHQGIAIFSRQHIDLFNHRHLDIGLDASVRNAELKSNGPHIFQRSGYIAIFIIVT